MSQRNRGSSNSSHAEHFGESNKTRMEEQREPVFVYILRSAGKDP
jgi:hypothetical protein